MFCNGVDVGAAAAAENEVELVSNFSALDGVGESFLQLSKRAAAVASTNKILLKRRFRVVFCVIDFFYVFNCKNSVTTELLPYKKKNLNFYSIR
jgi:hypothetical protein